MNETITRKGPIMTRTTTLALFGLACLMAMPSIAQARYQDGMNLYQYVRGNPVGSVDPHGLARLQYSYIGVWVDGAADMPDDQWRQTMAANSAFTRILEKDVEDLLWSYGVNAWRAGRKPDGDRLWHWGTRPQVGPRKYLDLTDLENTEEWKFVGAEARRLYGSADDVIVSVPGSIGWDGTKHPEWAAAHLSAYHVIAIARGFPQKLQPLWIAHEILHHLLGATVNPGATDPYHDTEGVMHPAGGSEKLGCKTVEALKRKGVTDADIDQNYVIK